MREGFRDRHGLIKAPWLKLVFKLKSEGDVMENKLRIYLSCIVFYSTDLPLDNSDACTLQPTTEQW